MLGVLKRRWRPKRASNANRIPSDSPTHPLDCDKPRSTPSARQVHPVCEEKAQLLVYDKRSLENNAKLQTIEPNSSPPPYPKRPTLELNAKQINNSKRLSPEANSNTNFNSNSNSKKPSNLDVNASPPPYPKRASLDSNPSPTGYPLAPNICVEGGRIEFIRQSPDTPIDGDLTPPPTPKLGGRVTVTRGQQTSDEEYEDLKDKLEARILKLEAALEVAQRTELKDKQLLTKLQKQLARRESAQRDADRERRLRADSEARAKQACQEASRCRSRLKLLTSEFSRMEDSVRSMLVYKKQAEQLRQEKAALTIAFENRCQQYQSTISKLNQEIFLLRQQLETSKNPNFDIQAAALQRHAEESRKQYERCLDDVANQVVRALLAQKGLREEIGSLNNRILELESQNKALTSMLVHQLRDSPSYSEGESNTNTNNKQLALEDSCCKESVEDNTSADVSPTNLMKSSLTLRHCNSFNSEILDRITPPEAQAEISPETDRALSRVKHLSADSDIIDSGFSLEDKKRHQVLNKLWSELKGTEVTPKKLLEALSAVDSSLWVPPQRPVSLNLQLPVLQATKYKKTRPILAQSRSKSEEETTGNESPESGNRDEGYSTMSSDVQAEVTRGSGECSAPTRGLEDLKEETELAAETRLLVADNKDPDILYIPLNLLNLKPRNSFPPGKDILPFQHIMRSFSDSHLCIKITTSPSPCYSFSSPISSSPSILLLDITDKRNNPLRRTKATTSLLGNSNVEYSEENTSPVSWTSVADDRIECSTWDTEYIQHWLRLDETRTTLQQHRDLFELEYDRTELEDWSLSLSNDDLREQWKKSDVTTPGQISLSTLPSIQENNALELEEDSSECLWNNSSYMMDREGHEIVTLLMDASTTTDKQWPYAINGHLTASPENSWSSGGSDYCHSHEPETCSKRSSAALSGCSDDTGELPAIGTDFTRDFYRLVKFESTKSLASTSSRSLGGPLSENGDREVALQNVLTFIAEQQKYVQARDSRPCSVTDVTKEFNIEGPPQHMEDLKNCECDSDLYISTNNKSSLEFNNPTLSENENYVTLKQLCTEFTLNEQNTKENENVSNNKVGKELSYAEEVCLVTPIDVESENCSHLSEHPVDICSSISVELTSTEYQSSVLSEPCDQNDNTKMEVSDISNSSDLVKSGDNVSSDISSATALSESLTSSVSTPDTIVSKIPRRKNLPSKIPVSPAKMSSTTTTTSSSSPEPSKLPKSKIPHKSPSSKISTRPKPNAQKQKIVKVQNDTPSSSQLQHVITSERLPQPTSGTISNIIDGPPHRAMSFHERATSKDVIDELNRMIKNGEDGPPIQEVQEPTHAKLDEACRPTGWVHVEKDVDLNDPKARANLLDAMMASVSSDSSPTSSCGGSITSDSTEEPQDYGHLHRIHRFHRQKKAHAARPEIAVVRAALPNTRPSIIGRPDFYVRYGDKEKEAVASFDFLDELSTTSSSLSCSIDENDRNLDDLLTSPSSYAEQATLKVGGGDSTKKFDVPTLQT